MSVIHRDVKRAGLEVMGGMRRLRCGAKKVNKQWEWSTLSSPSTPTHTHMHTNSCVAGPYQWLRATRIIILLSFSLSHTLLIRGSHSWHLPAHTVTSWTTLTHLLAMMYAVCVRTPWKAKEHTLDLCSHDWGNTFVIEILLCNGSFRLLKEFL